MRKNILMMVIIMSLLSGSFSSIIGIYDRNDNTAYPDVISSRYTSTSTQHFINRTYSNITPQVNEFYNINHTLKGDNGYIPAQNQYESMIILYQRFNFTRRTNITRVTYNGIKLDSSAYTWTMNFIIVYDMTDYTNTVYSDTVIFQPSDTGTYKTITFDIPSVQLEGECYFGIYLTTIPSIGFYVRTVKNTSAEGYIYAAYYPSNSSLHFLGDKVGYEDINMSVICTEVGYEQEYEFSAEIQPSIYDVADIVFVDTISLKYSHNTSLYDDMLFLYYENGSYTEYILNETGEYHFEVNSRITNVRALLHAEQYICNSIEEMFISIYKNDIPILIQDTTDIIIPRNSNFNINEYINTTDPDDDDIIIELSPNGIDTSIPGTYKMNITLYDDVKYPYIIHSYLNITIVNTPPEITNYTVVVEYNSSLYGRGYKNTSITLMNDRLNYINLSCPANSTITLSEIIEYNDDEGDTVSITSGLTPSLNKTTSVIYEVSLSDGYMTNKYLVGLSIDIPIEITHTNTIYVDRIVNHTNNQTVIEYRDRIVYVNNTIIKYKYIYANDTNSTSNSTSLNNKNDDDNTDTKSAWKDFLSKPSNAYPLIIALLILLSVSMIIVTILKLAPYYFDDMNADIDEDDEEEENEDENEDDDTEILEGEEVTDIDTFREDLDADGFSDEGVNIIDITSDEE